jgi:hypothetical protein
MANGKWKTAGREAVGRARHSVPVTFDQRSVKIAAESSTLVKPTFVPFTIYHLPFHAT